MVGTHSKFSKQKSMKLKKARRKAEAHQRQLTSTCKPQQSLAAGTIFLFNLLSYCY